MTALDLRGPVDTAGPRPFENMPEDLAVFGVDLAPEQLQFLVEAATHTPTLYRRMTAMTLVALADPQVPAGEALGFRAVTCDDEGEAAPVVVPALLEVDSSCWEKIDEEQPFWRRFPSVLGRVTCYSRDSGLIVSKTDAVRIWDCWPIEDDPFASRRDRDVIFGAVSQWWENNWQPYLDWIVAEENEDVICLDSIGIPDRHHRHEYDDEGNLRTCDDSRWWREHYRETALRYTGDEYYPAPLAPIEGLRHLQPAWDHLLRSSQQNILAAMSSYPTWEQFEVARTERHYTPWSL